MEIEGLDELLNSLGGMAELLDTGIKTVLNDTADDLVELTKERTNRITGNLQANWEHDTPVKDGEDYIVNIGSNVEYAKFVEEGHRQEVGRYVPAIGKKLKQSFVRGQWMLRDSVTEGEELFQNRLDEVIGGIFND